MSPAQTELIQKKLSKRVSQTYDDKKLRQDKKHIDKKTKAGYDGKEMYKKAKERQGKQGGGDEEENQGKAQEQEKERKKRKIQFC